MIVHITKQDRERITPEIWKIWKANPEFNALPKDVQEKRIILHLQIIKEQLTYDRAA